ncbi:opticin-like [Diretmus argenteus]
MRCGTGWDIVAASEKHWCRLANVSVCQPETVMDRVNEARGDFKILDISDSFSLEKRQLMYNDSGQYRCTVTFQNRIKTSIVTLLVQSYPTMLVVPQQPNLKQFQLACQYPQEFQELPKYWLCNNKPCSLKTVDDYFQSSLELTVDNVACSSYDSFQCVFEDFYPAMPSSLNPTGKDYIDVKSGGTSEPRDDYINTPVNDGVKLDQGQEGAYAMVVTMCELRMSLQSLVLALVLLSPCPSTGAPQGDLGPDDGAFDLENYDLNDEMDWENLELNNYGETYDYDDLDQEIEVGTVAPETPPQANEPPAEYLKEEVTLPPQHTPPDPITLDFKGPGLFGPETGLGMTTCLLCVCIGGSVYCEDTSLEHIPPLPKDTTHFYGRFNKLRHVKNTDFINLNKLKSIDLTGNQISGMDEDAFRSLPQLQELLLADNNLQALPELPITMKRIDVRNNRLISGGVHPEGFKDMSQLEFLYLSNNKLDYIPTPLPESLRVLHLQNNNIQHLHESTFCKPPDHNYIRRNLEDIRLDGNPLDINLFAQAYVCLLRLPVGGR